MAHALRTYAAMKHSRHPCSTRLTSSVSAPIRSPRRIRSALSAPYPATLVVKRSPLREDRSRRGLELYAVADMQWTRPEATSVDDDEIPFHALRRQDGAERTAAPCSLSSSSCSLERLRPRSDASKRHALGRNPARVDRATCVYSEYTYRYGCTSSGKWY